MLLLLLAELLLLKKGWSNCVAVLFNVGFDSNPVGLNGVSARKLLHME